MGGPVKGKRITTLRTTRSKGCPVFDPIPEMLPPSIMPVIILKGSDYEMGLQYGQQAAPYDHWKE